MDTQLLDLLEFEFPLGYDRSRSLQATEVNHTSALKFPDHIKKYLQMEMAFGTIYGPLDSKPFNMHVSSFMTSEKVGSTKLGVIVAVMQVFHWGRLVGKYAFVESRDQCLRGRLGLVVVSWPVGERWQNFK